MSSEKPKRINMMKTGKVLAGMAIIATVGAVFVVFDWRQDGDDLAVEEAVVDLKASRSQQEHGVKSESTVEADLNDNELVETPGVASKQVLVNAIALSSFFASASVADLSDLQLARLENVLSEARSVTYKLLLERGSRSEFPDGRIQIEIPAQGDALDGLREYAYEAIQEIVGKEKMESLEEHLDRGFEAKFAYFGKYPTVIEFSFDGVAIDEARYITMKSQYSRVELLGTIAAGKMRATNVLPVSRFEADYVPLSMLKGGG